MASTGIKRKATEIAASEAKKPKANASIESFFGKPKVVAKTNATAPDVPESAISFDKEKWLAKLTDEQKELLKLEIETLHESWLAYLKDEVTSKEFLNLKRFLKQEVESGKTVFPPMEDVYSWLVHCFHNSLISRTSQPQSILPAHRKLANLSFPSPGPDTRLSTQSRQ